MKKIIIGVGSLVVTYSLLAGSALALFLPQTKLTAMQFKTSNYLLLVQGNSNTTPLLKPNDTAAGAFHLHPGGDIQSEHFKVENDSDQPMHLMGQMQAGDGDWNALKDLVKVSVFSQQYNLETNSFTLADWVAGPKDLPNPDVGQNAYRDYYFHYSFPSVYPVDPDATGPLKVGDLIGSEAMNKLTSNVTFIITGTPN